MIYAGLESSRHTHKEKSGFTHAHNSEPVTFRPHENFTGSLPGHMTWRPTGSSIMKNDFYEPHYMKVRGNAAQTCKGNTPYI